ncbi:dihydrolipoamide acetyltransferase family protein [Pseudolysinimonas yzui]|uniref:Dihydrolipoamide acetyltransferase component of pyruvate dehydrogenase complex n=1 Tax=Pseudolysinimonas yzui TaxID=2708254 RepID=A0A8J3M216_9MICO|nr:dihydrolipoamide acetyltransferase family protein [Pseudolysinimonas yzui]GHF19606.1 dihydrolipoyllysine-residue acetyltransferase component of pyruvate dehydrogenase complex [Pseudolysinimonas yzui]
MASVVRMPAALAGVTEAAIQTWIAKPGQQLAVGDLLAEIETEKAVVEYATEVAGTVGRLLVDEGDSIEVGAPIAVILAAGEGEDAIGPALTAAGAAAPERLEPAEPAAAEPASAEAVAPAVVATPPTEVSVASPPSGASAARLVASPIVRRLARERGIDLAALTGTGPGGRIVRRDLDGIPAAAATAPVATAPSSAPPPTPATAAAGTPEKLTGMRKAIARRLTESKTTVPHFYVTAHCRVDRLLALRAQVNEAAPRKVSVNDFVLKAVAGALVDVPAANAIWGGDHILRFTGADIAVAVAVEGGLLTPVLRGVDSLSLVDVSAAVAELAERARAGRLQQHELEGGSFSVSNLGMYGVDDFSAILNPPQSGILAVSAAKQQPVVDDGVLAVGTVMTVTLSADHRVIDGAVAAEWMTAFVRRIENPVSALL